MNYKCKTETKCEKTDALNFCLKTKKWQNRGRILGRERHTSRWPPVLRRARSFALLRPTYRTGRQSPTCMPPPARASSLYFVIFSFYAKINCTWTPLLPHMLFQKSSQKCFIVNTSLGGLFIKIDIKVCAMCLHIASDFPKLPYSIYNKIFMRRFWEFHGLKKKNNVDVLNIAAIGRQSFETFRKRYMEFIRHVMRKHGMEKLVIRGNRDWRKMSKRKTKKKILRKSAYYVGRTTSLRWSWSRQSKTDSDRRRGLRRYGTFGRRRISARSDPYWSGIGPVFYSHFLVNCS